MKAEVIAILEPHVQTGSEGAAVVVEESSRLVADLGVDSLGVMEIVAFLEETYDIPIDDDELVADNLDSVERLTKFVDSKLTP